MLELIVVPLGASQVLSPHSADTQSRGQVDASSAAQTASPQTNRHKKINKGSA